MAAPRPSGGTGNEERTGRARPFAFLTTGAGPVDPHAWQRLVFAQFHDYIPGSSIWEVYEEGLPELRHLAEEAEVKAKQALGTGNFLVNLLPMTRRVATANGVVELPPLSASDIDSLPAVETDADDVSGDSIAAGRVRAAFNDRGEVSGLSIDGEEMPLTGPLNGLVLYPDHPHQFDAWDIDRQTLHLGEAVASAAERTDWSPDIGVGMAFIREIGEKSRVEIRYWIDPAQPVLQMELLLDWHTSRPATSTPRAATA